MGANISTCGFTPRLGTLKPLAKKTSAKVQGKKNVAKGVWQGKMNKQINKRMSRYLLTLNSCFCVYTVTGWSAPANAAVPVGADSAPAPRARADAADDRG